MSRSERNNQLVNINNYDVNRMVFSEPQVGSIPNTPISFKRISISTLNEDGSIGDLILPTEELFSFGVGENVNQQTQKVDGYTLSLCLWDRTNPSAAQKKWTDVFNAIVENAKKHLLDNKEELELYDLSEADLKKFNPLYWKREKGKIVEGTGPTLYAKLIQSKKHNKIMTMFFDSRGDPIDPLTLLGKYNYARAAIKIESIFLGNKISLQVKLYEAECRLIETGMRSLLSRPTNTGRMITNESKTSEPKPVESKVVDDDDAGSLHNSEDETEAPAPEPVRVQPEKTVKKVVRKVKASPK
jgi:hypothetical protein